MALKTLEELNRDFLIEGPTQEQKTKYQPITPCVIEVELPRTTRLRGAEKRGSGTPESCKEQTKPKRPKKKRGLFTAISDMLFSLAIIMILFVVLIPSSDGGAPKMIFDYSYFTVLSPSMQDEIPQGSFILVKQVDPLKLKKGDNITFMVDRNTSVTHKIIDIYENYNSSEARGFQTQGVNNINPDPDIVYEANIVGKVVFVLPAVGAILSNLAANAFLVFIIFSLCVLLSFFLRGLFPIPVKLMENKSRFKQSGRAENVQKARG